MADVKWIKITTDIFDDEKILLIESLPDAYAIIVVWFKLLCLAGKQNNSGVFMMGQIAYTDKMLATIFRMKESTVTMALRTFEQFGMVEIIDGVITIPNWGKHQNLDQLESKKEYMRNYMKEYREKQKALTTGKPSCKTNGKTNVSEADKEEDKDKETEEEKKNNKPTKHKYGEYNNVLLTDEELDKLKSEYSDWQERIERLSSYVASTGKSYKSHYATIRNWARKDGQTQKQGGRKEMVPKWMKDKDQEQAFDDRLKKDMDWLKQFSEDNDLTARAEALRQSLQVR